MIIKESLKITGLIILMLFLSGIGIVGQYIIFDCMPWTCAPKRDFQLEDLELSTSLFPGPHHLISPYHRKTDDLSRGIKEEMFMSVYWENKYDGFGTAMYRIEKAASIEWAQKVVQFDQNSTKRNVSNTNYTSPFVSQVADEQILICGPTIRGRECWFAARYQEYVVFFNSSIDYFSMKESDFIGIVKIVDQQIGEKLYSNK